MSEHADLVVLLLWFVSHCGVWLLLDDLIVLDNLRLSLLVPLCFFATVELSVSAAVGEQHLVLSPLSVKPFELPSVEILGDDVDLVAQSSADLEVRLTRR